MTYHKEDAGKPCSICNHITNEQGDCEYCITKAIKELKEEHSALSGSDKRRLNAFKTTRSPKLKKHELEGFKHLNDHNLTNNPEEN